MKRTANQDIKPITARINDKDNLEIGGCDCIELAEKYGSPLYVYDEATIRSILNDYKKAFSNYENFQPLFASKAFMTSTICKIMQSEGFGLDVVSGGEIYTALKSDFDMSKTLFNGSNKSIEELELAIDSGVGRFSVDNFLELALLDNIAKNKNTTVSILLRITPGIECHTHEYIQTGHIDSKFGFDLSQVDEAIELINDEYSNLSLVGMHVHLGSQIFETKVYFDAVKIILEEFKRIKEKFELELSELNIGGGLGITYTNNDDPPSIFEIAEIIINSINKHTKEFGLILPKLYIEPGRSVVGTAGITLYTTGSSKKVPTGRKYVAVDGGMADNPRPSMYQAQYDAIIANKANHENTQDVTIAGRFCESGDIVIKNIKLPIIEEGDILAVFNTGAYGYSMSSNYNGVLKPAVVLVNNGKSDIIIERESYEDLISHNRVPQWLK